MEFESFEVHSSQCNNNNPKKTSEEINYSQGRKQQQSSQINLQSDLYSLDTQNEQSNKDHLSTEQEQSQTLFQLKSYGSPDQIIVNSYNKNTFYQDESKNPFNLIKNKYQNTLICNPLLEFYFISGNICVMECALNKEFTRFSHLNSCKIPIQTKIYSPLGILEVDLNSKRGGIQNFEFIVQKLKSKSNFYVYKFSLLLEKYQKFINSSLEKQELLKYEQFKNQFLAQIVPKFDQFVSKCQEIIKEIAQNHPFFSYTLNQFNLQTFEMEMRKFGFSEAILALLGVDMNQAQQFIWRKGLFDFLDKKNIQEMLYQYISFILGEDLIQTHDITLFTFDGYEVYATNNIKIFVDRDVENPFLGINQVLFVNIYDVSPNMVKQIISLRGQNQNLSQEKIKLLEEDLSYSMEANIFLQKYYKDVQENFLHYNKRAGYRLIQN